VTELAYLADIDAAYVRSFTARVAALPPGGIVLERTYFYPTGGGQPSDAGTIARTGPEPGAFDVVDVTKSGPSVVHRIRPRPGAARPPAVGEEVTGTIDWERRHRHMRLHTAQHFLSARIYSRADRRTRKASMSGTRAILDLDGPLSPDLVGPLLEDLVDAVRVPRRVAIRHLPRTEWDRLPAAGRSGLVPLPAQVESVRVIEIDGIDVCPCGGTHLRSTGEIGTVALAPPQPLGDGTSRVTLTLSEGAPPTRSA
jgi:misacylated tRNA(Ala) deacylase